MEYLGQDRGYRDGSVVSRRFGKFHFGDECYPGVGIVSRARITLQKLAREDWCHVRSYLADVLSIPTAIFPILFRASVISTAVMGDNISHLGSALSVVGAGSSEWPVPA